MREYIGQQPCTNTSLTSLPGTAWYHPRTTALPAIGGFHTGGKTLQLCSGLKALLRLVYRRHPCIFQALHIHVLRWLSVHVKMCRMYVVHVWLQPRSLHLLYSRLSQPVSCTWFVLMPTHVTAHCKCLPSRGMPHASYLFVKEGYVVDGAVKLTRHLFSTVSFGLMGVCCDFCGIVVLCGSTSTTVVHI